MPNLFSANGNTLKVLAGQDYDPGITPEIDKAIRHMPDVILKMLEKAATLKNSTGSSNFEIITQARPDTQRPRAYVVPKNHDGIREELADAVLLKAAMGMSGK
jgi:nitrogen-specific signal transduction histidine kinase